MSGEVSVRPTPDHSESARMFEFPDALQDYTPSILALVFVAVYFAPVFLIVRRPGPQHVAVPCYQPPRGASPAVAAWLLEGDLSRAVAAALVNMAAKGYVKIEQSKDLRQKEGVVPRKRPRPNCQKSFKVVLPKRTAAPQHSGCPFIRFGSLDLK